MAEEPLPDSDLEPFEPELPRRRRRPRMLPPPPGAEERAPRQVHRTRRDRVIGGVCGGIGYAYGIDPTFIRALFVLGAFAGGAGAVAYGIALFLLPLEPPALARPAPETGRQDLALAWIGVGVVVAGAIALSRIEALRYRLLTLDKGGMWPLLLAGLAVWVVATRRREPAEGTEPRTRRFTRPRRDRLLYGVASGFARYTRVDANLVRVTLVVVAVWSYGIGAVLYLALAAFIPEDAPPA